MADNTLIANKSKEPEHLGLKVGQRCEELFVKYIRSCNNKKIVTSVSLILHMIVNDLFCLHQRNPLVNICMKFSYLSLSNFWQFCTYKNIVH